LHCVILYELLLNDLPSFSESGRIPDSQVIVACGIHDRNAVTYRVVFNCGIINSATADKPRDAFAQCVMAWMPPNMPLAIGVTTQNLVVVRQGLEYPKMEMRWSPDHLG